MRTTEHTVDAKLPSLKPAASRLNGFSRLVKSVWRLVHSRMQVNRLNDLDDHMLLDMGLRREDLHAAMTSPFFSDPAEHLTRTVRNRSQKFYRDARRR